jgi:hypothetical protein
MKPKTILILTLISLTAVILSGVIRPILSWSTSTSESTYTVELSADKVVNGSLLVVQFDPGNRPTPVSDIHVKFQQRTIPASEHPIKIGTYFALVGIPMKTKPGRAELILEWIDGSSHQMRTLPIRIHVGKYRMEKLSVDPGKVELSAANLARVKHEKQEIKIIYAQGSQARLWEGLFQLPVNGDITSPYGNQRMFNGQLRSYHNGVDFRAPVGKPVYAANSGIVRSAKNLFFSGNIVIVDHGTGIFSHYAHLSKINVTGGQPIQKGEIVGLSGATGRVSGPHLHWGIKVNGVYVNPLHFVDVIASMIAQ